jgi:hypothetical protein
MLARQAIIGLEAGHSQRYYNSRNSNLFAVLVFILSPGYDLITLALALYFFLLQACSHKYLPALQTPS